MQTKSVSDVPKVPIVPIVQRRQKRALSFDVALFVRSRIVESTPCAVRPTGRLFFDKYRQAKVLLGSKTFGTSGTFETIGTGHRILIPNVLQKPFGRNLTPEAGSLGELVDLTRHRVELGALQIAALGIRDLIRRAAPFHLAGDEIGERDAAIGQRVAVLAAVAAAVAVLMLLWARLVADMLGVGGELGMAGGRRRVA